MAAMRYGRAGVRRLADAYNSTYDLTDDDIGHQLRVTVSVVTDAGSAAVTSELTADIGDDASTAEGHIAYLDAPRHAVHLDLRDGTEHTTVATCAQLTGSTDCYLMRPRISPNLKMIAVEASAPLAPRGTGAIYRLSVRPVGDGASCVRWFTVRFMQYRGHRVIGGLEIAPEVCPEGVEGRALPEQ
jgi:hypothetical protein